METADCQRWLNEWINNYCVDPNGDTRAYGEGAKGTLDDVCTEATGTYYRCAGSVVVGLLTVAFTKR